jgi:hypothetical protein
MTLDRIRIQLTSTRDRVVVPAGTRFTQLGGIYVDGAGRRHEAGSMEYRTKRAATFGFWRRLWWRLRCLVARRQLPQSIRIPVERIG